MKSKSITYVEGSGRLDGGQHRRGRRHELHRPQHRPRDGFLRQEPARPRHRRTGHHQRPGPAAGPDPSQRDRPRRGRHRRGVRAACGSPSAPRSRSSRPCPGWSRPRTSPAPRRWSAPSASARSSSRPACGSRGVTQDDNGVVATLEDGTTVSAELMLVAVGRGPNTSGMGYEEDGVTMDRGWVLTDERLRTNVQGVFAVGDIVPGLQLAHRGFAQGIFVAEEIAGLNPPAIDETGHPAGHLLRAGDRLGRTHRGPGQGEVRRRLGRVLRVQPRRQRQEPDSGHQRVRQAGPAQGRARRRRPHGGRTHG